MTTKTTAEEVLATIALNRSARDRAAAEVEAKVEEAIRSARFELAARHVARVARVGRTHVAVRDARDVREGAARKRKGWVRGIGVCALCALASYGPPLVAVFLSR
jgi:hypothetical protein